MIFLQYCYTLYSKWEPIKHFKWALTQGFLSLLTLSLLILIFSSILLIKIHTISTNAWHNPEKIVSAFSAGVHDLELRDDMQGACQLLKPLAKGGGHYSQKLLTWNIRFFKWCKICLLLDVLRLLHKISTFTNLRFKCLEFSGFYSSMKPINSIKSLVNLKNIKHSVYSINVSLYLLFQF